MARKPQQMSIDGINIDLSKGRFANTFDIAEGDEKLIATDEEVVFVVIAQVNSVRFAPTKSGDHVRVNAFKVQEARLVRDEAEKTKLLDRFRFGYKPQPSLFDALEDLKEEHGEDLPVRYVGGATFPQDLDEDLVLVEDDDSELDDIDREMQEFLDAAKTIADEYDSDDEKSDSATITSADAYDARKNRNIVGEAKGMAASDPVLAKFLEV